MINKLFIVLAIMALALSACNGGGTAEATTPAVTDTQIATAAVAATQMPAVTETLTVTPGTPGTEASVTATVGTVAPTNPPDCKNSAGWVADITIPDETTLAPAATFTKTWRIVNNGTCVWGPTYTLTHYSEERMAAPDSVPLGITYPGQNLDISVDLTAPNSTGRHQANFVIKNPAGLIMNIGEDSRLWVVINVAVGGAAASTTAVTGTAAATSAPATLAPATLIPATALGAATATRTTPAATASGSGSGTTTCLFTIDRTTLTEVINAINAYRADNGLPAFTVNPRLAQAAQRHSIDMACNGRTDHTGSDNSTPQSRVAATGYKAAAVAENIYSSSPPFTGEGVVNSWVTDTANPTNNQNLLSTNFTQIGVGYSQFENSGYYVLVLARP